MGKRHPCRSNTQSETVNWLVRCYDPQQVLFASNLPANSLVMVASGLAYSLNIEGTLHIWSPTAIVYRPLDLPLRSTGVLAWRQDQPFGLAAEKSSPAKTDKGDATMKKRPLAGRTL